MNITIKSIPDEVGAQLKEAAHRANRSLNREIIHRLNCSLHEGELAAKTSVGVADSPDQVADAWLALAGRWKSELSVEAEIESLYASRSSGRDQDLLW